MIKIASLFESIKIGGGVEKIQSNMSIGLTDKGYDFIHIVLEDKKPRNDYKGYIICLGEKFITGFGLKKIILLFRIAWRVKKICQTKKVDILIGQGDFFFMVTGLVKLFGNKSKSIAVVHTSIGIWNNFITKALLFFIKQHDYIIMTSKQELDTFVSKYKVDKSRIFLIYNSIDIAKTLELGSASVPDRWEFLFQSGKKSYVNLARLNYQKNQQLLIKAFHQLENKKNYQLIIIGEGKERSNLEKLIQELDLQESISLVGNQSNPHAFVARSDYRVLSSRFEGFPVVFAEGGLFKKPIIAIDCPTGPREFLDPQKKIGAVQGFSITDNGILVQFDDKDHHHLYKAMEYIQNNTIKVQQEQAYKYVQMFDNVVNAKQRDTLIQSLV